MNIILSFVTFAIATMFAVAAASGLTWIVLQVAIALMQPAAAHKPATRPQLVHGTTQLARAFATNR